MKMKVQFDSTQELAEFVAIFNSPQARTVVGTHSPDTSTTKTPKAPVIKEEEVFDRKALEQEAEAKGVPFRSSIGDASLRAKIDSYVKVEEDNKEEEVINSMMTPTKDDEAELKEQLLAKSKLEVKDEKANKKEESKSDTKEKVNEEQEENKSKESTEESPKDEKEEPATDRELALVEPTELSKAFKSPSKKAVKPKTEENQGKIDWG